MTKEVKMNTQSILLQKRKRQSGFTLMELLVVLAILGLTISPARFFPLAIIAVAERTSYALLRSYAHQQAWHRA